MWIFYVAWYLRNRNQTLFYDYQTHHPLCAILLSVFMCCSSFIQFLNFPSTIFLKVWATLELHLNIWYEENMLFRKQPKWNKHLDSWTQSWCLYLHLSSDILQLHILLDMFSLVMMWRQTGNNVRKLVPLEF